jgi:hypothetical protein
MNWDSFYGEESLIRVVTLKRSGNASKRRRYLNININGERMVENRTRVKEYKLK